MNESLSGHFNYSGKCGLCGHPDARHRIVDAWVERTRAGEPADAVADDYGVPVVLVEVAVLAATGGTRNG